MLLPPFEEYVLDGDGYTAATTFILEASRCAELERDGGERDERGRKDEGRFTYMRLESH